MNKSKRAVQVALVTAATLGGLLWYSGSIGTTAQAGAPPGAQAGEGAKKLYERLGGYDAISAVVGEFSDRVFADQKLAPFFGGWTSEKQAHFKQLNVLMVCAATGGPCTYIGRTMPVTHKGMGVSDPNFDQVASHLVATLDKFKVPKTEKSELLAIIGGLRGDIVGK